MANFEFDYSDNDFQLIGTQQDVGNFENSYVRIIVYPTEAIDNIVTLNDSTKGLNGQAIFFGRLHGSQFPINISPYLNKIDDITQLTIYPNDDLNDFKVYRNNIGKQ